MTKFQKTKELLRQEPRKWLVTGAAGFIGSHLVETLLSLDQEVVGLDNLSTGKRENLVHVQGAVSTEQWGRFRFIEGDVRALEDCRSACEGVNYVLHQAALGSVPRSIQDPLRSHQSNVDGFLNLLVAARDAQISRFVFASSSSVYGDHPTLPKREALIGAALSPYAATKLIGETYAGVFSRCYDIETVALRYFNVFGPRQDPSGAYAAVIPLWVDALLSGKPIHINGDGETSRDFCYVANVVQANILAATAPMRNRFCVYNIACGGRTTLRSLLEKIKASAEAVAGTLPPCEIVMHAERKGDVRHSHADIGAAIADLGYAPEYSIDRGLKDAAAWYHSQRMCGVEAGG